jgi:hypothetical protein
MATQWKLIIVAALIMLAATFIWSGRYTISAQGHRVFVVDRFTGAVRVCTEDECTVPHDPGGVVKADAVAQEEPSGQQWPGTPTKLPRDPWVVVKEEPIEPKEPSKQQWPGIPAKPETGPWTGFQKAPPN